MQSLKVALSSLLAVSALVPACANTNDDGSEWEEDSDGKADGSSVSPDNLNGLWDGKLGTAKVNDVTVRSWSALGIEMDVGGKTVKLTRTANKLKGEGVELDIKGNAAGPNDDELVGKVNGKAFTVHRDTDPKDTITLKLPKDRPFRMFLADQLAPAAQKDRESYVVMDADKIKDFMKSTVLFKAGSFQRKYMKGANRTAQDKEFFQMIDDMDGLEVTPRNAISNVKFSNAVKAHLKDASLAGLALTNFNLYFTTGAGRSLIIPFDDTTYAYFITDRPARAEKLGLVVMNTPTHAPLASTFGRQLLDLGEMSASDTKDYATAMMDLLVKSDPVGASALDDKGKSALIDWFSVMAIEDYRGYSFGNAELGWGYNLTNAQFYGLVVRALGNQVIVDDKLRPGDPSYVDVLNSGNDMQEYPEMAQLKKLATDYLTEKHADLITEVKASLKGIVPDSELDSRAQEDIFHYVCAQLYDAQGRQSVLTGAKADRVVKAVGNLVGALVTDKTQFEQYVLAHDVTKSTEPAPKSDGF